MSERLQNVSELLEQVSDMFYQNRLEEGIGKMPQLIKVLAETAPKISKEKQAAFTHALKDLMESMERQDYILSADILVFEMKDLL